MNRRLRVVGATALTIIGGAVVVVGLGGGPALQATGIAQTGFDLTKFLVWGGVAALVISAFLFISASSE